MTAVGVPRPLECGEWVEMPGGWRVVASLPDPWRPGCYRWRDGQCYTAPEIIDPEAEGRLQHAPVASEPDGLSRVGDYIVVRAHP